MTLIPQIFELAAQKSHKSRKMPKIMIITLVILQCLAMAKARSEETVRNIKHKEVENVF